VKNTGPSDLSRRVSAELRATAARRGTTWLSIEKATGIPHATMQRMIKGESDIPISKLMLICEAMGVPAMDVIAEATRLMPDNYLHNLLADPDASPATSSVVDIRSTNWETYQGKKAADVDDETETDHPS
jgi:DNA-binding Xre family transcriptional regulator